MLVRLALAVFVAGLTGLSPAAAQDAGLVFSLSLPEIVGDVSGWERITGDFETTTARGAYRLYVNPARPAIYQLVRYRVELTGSGRGGPAPRRAAERVAFVRRPGVREPMLFWEHDPAAGDGGWRAIAAGTDEYRLEIAVFMAVLGAHRTATTTPPAS